MEKHNDRVELVKKIDTMIVEGGTIDEAVLATEMGWDLDRLRKATTYLKQHEYLDSTTASYTHWLLTEEGKKYVEEGLPECTVVDFVRASPSPVSMDILKGDLPASVVDWGLKTCMKKKWLAMDKATKRLTCTEKCHEADSARTNLKAILDRGQEGSSFSESMTADVLNEFKHRNIAVPKTIKIVSIMKGSKFQTDLPKMVPGLTHQMMVTNSYKNVDFKPANFAAAGKPLVSMGSLHPLDRQLKRFRDILTLMGFEEMATHRWVENAFWNFDALFQPQKHPARDAHDTFYIKDPKASVLRQHLEDYVSNVKCTHEKGGWGSVGYKYQWCEKEAAKNVLRTHTTAVTAQMLYELAQETKRTGRFVPRKYFSIDRVFRNETLDATHLAEFHQIEGIVASRTDNLATLMGIMRVFYKNIGIEKLRFKPTYNPYTEPSMEIYGFHPKLEKWIEVGNSGVFRPEMLRPMGFDEDVSVLGWGLSLERPTMIRYNIENIRDMFGAKAKLSVDA
eukprot:GHVO01033369.1.p1 GENE.GHVO01033369.1~~GHVO01033369.1.p1  ORF type:complete len:595 (+),score=108.40 GHVO01033369.1:266-1786(+)